MNTYWRRVKRADDVPVGKMVRNRCTKQTGRVIDVWIADTRHVVYNDGSSDWCVPISILDIR